MVLRRLENTAKRLIKRPEIEKYIEKEYVSKVTNDTATRKWYLPHVFLNTFLLCHTLKLLDLFENEDERQINPAVTSVLSELHH
jgi:hypothetical protein